MSLTRSKIILEQSMSQLTTCLALVAENNAILIKLINDESITDEAQKLIALQNIQMTQPDPFLYDPLTGAELKKSEYKPIPAYYKNYMFCMAYHVKAVMELMRSGEYSFDDEISVVQQLLDALGGDGVVSDAWQRLDNYTRGYFPEHVGKALSQGIGLVFKAG